MANSRSPFIGRGSVQLGEVNLGHSMRHLIQCILMGCMSRADGARSHLLHCVLCLMHLHSVRFLGRDNHNHLLLLPFSSTQRPGRLAVPFRLFLHRSGSLTGWSELDLFLVLLFLLLLLNLLDLLLLLLSLFLL
ncbi:hypothetical protein PENTCL1PPCAC_263, partial [Pristionchus entomophagus]